jgi:hypothetical protein
MRLARLANNIFAAVVLTVVPAVADPAIDALVSAYPDSLAGSEGNLLIWKDGTRMPISDGQTAKSFEQLLDHPDIKDQFAVPYPLGIDLKHPVLNEDPGRIRFQPLFLKMYGDCRKGEVVQHLKAVRWLRGNTILATSVNGVADKLAAVARELEQLPGKLTRFMVPAAGTYNCRAIAKTHRLSVHAYGAALDLNPRYGDYWLWPRRSSRKAWNNRIPLAIVEIFERHGFIWGGKWYHYDTMHFEYRPELIGLAKKGWPRD